MSGACITAPRKIFVFLSCLALLAGCGEFGSQSELEPVPEVWPGFLQGYLPAGEWPDSLTLLPPPPSQGTALLALDEEVSRSSLAMRDTARWRLATEDADLKFPQAAGTFSCALNTPITEQDTPQLYRLLRRSLADAAIATDAAKAHYRRPRPFMVNREPICSPDQAASLAKNGSYPSGHTAIGWTWALILSELAPDRSNAILARGRAFGESRVICNVHWQSDVTEGRFIGSAVVARLHAEPVFEKAMKAAKAELAAVRAKGLPPQRDCEVEAEALVVHPSANPEPTRQ